MKTRGLSCIVKWKAHGMIYVIFVSQNSRYKVSLSVSRGNSDVITIIFIFKWEIATSLMPLFLYSYIQMLLCSIVEIEFKRKSEIIQINMWKTTRGVGVAQKVNYSRSNARRVIYNNYDRMNKIIYFRNKKVNLWIWYYGYSE